MRPRDLARQRETAAAADEPGRRDAVVRGAKRARPVQRAVTGQLAEQTSHLGDLERFPQLERGQDSRQAAREHGLARARRTAQQQVVAARRCNLQGALGLFLTVHLGQVVFSWLNRRMHVGAGLRRGDQLGPQQVIDDREERGTRDHLEAVDQGGLGGVFRRDEDALVAEPAQATRGDQHPVDMAHRPIEGELTEERGARRRRLVRARQGDRDGDRKVETRALLAQLGRREIDGETRVGEFQAAVADRGADAFACLLHGRRGQADQGELAVAATGDVCLDVDAAHVKAGEHA